VTVKRRQAAEGLLGRLVDCCGHFVRTAGRTGGVVIGLNCGHLGHMLGMADTVAVGPDMDYNCPESLVNVRAVDDWEAHTLREGGNSCRFGFDSSVGCS
jgi:hypothetical protein